MTDGSDSSQKTAEQVALEHAAANLVRASDKAKQATEKAKAAAEQAATAERESRAAAEKVAKLEGAKNNVAKADQYKIDTAEQAAGLKADADALAAEASRLKELKNTKVAAAEAATNTANATAEAAKVTVGNLATAAAEASSKAASATEAEKAALTEAAVAAEEAHKQAAEAAAAKNLELTQAAAAAVELAEKATTEFNAAKTAAEEKKGAAEAAQSTATDAATAAQAAQKEAATATPQAITAAKTEAAQRADTAEKLKSASDLAAADERAAAAELSAAALVDESAKKAAAGPTVYNTLARQLTLQGSWQRHLAVTGILSAIVLILHFVALSFANGLACDWLKDDYKLLRTDPKPMEVKEDAPAERLMRRLETQGKTTRERGLRHLKIAQFFYERYYMAIRLATFLSLIAGICLVWISRNGFNDSSAIIKTIFLLSTVGTAYFLTYPAIYGQKENLTVNGKKWEQHVALNQEIVTFKSAYGTTSKWDDSGKSWTEAALPFIKKVDKRLADLNGLNVTLDASAVSGLEQTLEGGTPKAPVAGEP